MTTTKEQIREWFVEGVKQKATHMAIVCDTFDWEDYPVYIKKGEDSFKATQNYRDGVNMTQLMEVYDLRKDIEEQLSQSRCFNY